VIGTLAVDGWAVTFDRVLTTLENMEISGNLLILENTGKTQGI